MTRIDNSFNIITLSLILAISLAAMGSAFAKSPNEPEWLWPTKSIPVAQSTKALVMGRNTNAIAHAERALDKVRDYDRIVALQNLCIGWLRMHETEKAEPYCASVLSAASALQLSRTKSGDSTLDIVKSNIKLTREAYGAPSSIVVGATGNSSPTQN
jgi:hypothetical protein